MARVYGLVTWRDGYGRLNTRACWSEEQYYETLLPLLFGSGEVIASILLDGSPHQPGPDSGVI
jgi:hypothetical protein